MEMDTDAILEALARIGCPWLNKTRAGKWVARIDLPTPDGVSLEVKSDIDHPTHRSALLQLVDRLQGLISFNSDLAKIVSITPKQISDKS